jgi:polyferredoxin
MKKELQKIFGNESKRQKVIRRVVQVVVAFILLIAGWHFSQFVGYVRGLGPEAGRPPVAEGFLPIAGIIAFKVYTSSGVFDTIHPAGLTIFIATIVTAFLFRRALCSWICPIGALSEQLGLLGKRLMGKNLKVPKWLDITLLSIKFLIFTGILLVFVSMSFDDAAAFMREPFYALSDIRLFDMFSNLGIVGIMFMLVMLVLSVFVKSFWCRYLCPYGALLGVIGAISPVILKKDDKTCTHCRSCNRACINGVNISDKNNFVVTTECMGCTSCVTACPNKGTLQFKLFGVTTMTPFVYAISLVVIFFAIIAIAQLSGHWDTVLTIEKFRELDIKMATGGF